MTARARLRRHTLLAALFLATAIGGALTSFLQEGLFLVAMLASTCSLGALVTQVQGVLKVRQVVKAQDVADDYLRRQVIVAVDDHDRPSVQ